MEKITDNAIDFLKKIKKTDGVIIVFNNDLDGISSCVGMKKYLKTIGNDPYIISQPMPPDKNLIKRMQTGIPNKIIFLDMAIDQTNVVKKIKGIADILIVDHHVVQHNLNSDNVVHLNPRIKDPKIYQSASYLVYKLVSKIDDIDGLDWISALGAIADYDLTSSQDLMKKVEKKYDLKWLRKIVHILDSLKTTRAMSCEQVVEALIKMKEPQEVMERKDFIKHYEDVENEINGILINAQSEAKVIGSVVFYEMKSKYNLRSIISTKLSEKYKGKFVIVWEKVGKKINGSVRDQDKKFNTNTVLKKAIEGFEGAAGGHEAAGGITVDEKDWESVKDNILSIVNGS